MEGLKTYRVKDNNFCLNSQLQMDLMERNGKQNKSRRISSSANNSARFFIDLFGGAGKLRFLSSLFFKLKYVSTRN